MKIKKGDTIKITVGKDRNKTGKVLKVLPSKNKIIIEGLNLYKKHVRPKNQGEKGQVVSVPRPMNVSNVLIMCQGCGRATRVGYHLEGENKIRICKRCGANLS